MEKYSGCASDREIAKQAAKLWPHREHEASMLLAQCCRIGIHFWRKLDLTELVPGHDISFCFWCSKVKVNGTVYDP